EASLPGPLGPAAAVTSNSYLYGVAATSATNAWAVGFTASSQAFQTLIMRWKGTSWKRVSSPDPAGGGQLNGVAATAADSAWAVGSYLTGSGTAGTLIERWNGTSWKLVTGSGSVAG